MGQLQRLDEFDRSLAPDAEGHLMQATA